jgi:cobalt-zinc-cadmium efflux system outer membrane protein
MKIYALFYLLIISVNSFSQKKITIVECEQAFLKNNLILLAGKYDIDIANANVIQAKIWSQPYIYAEFNAINPQNKRYFDAGAQGEKLATIQQLIYLGGKKRNQVNYAKANVKLNELYYEDLLRGLKLELRKNFYSAYFNLKKIKSIELQQTNIDTLLNSYATQANKGNIALKEVVRLQSFSLNLKNIKVQIQQDLNEQKKNLNLITGIREELIPFEESNFNTNKYLLKELKIGELENIALLKNPEYLIAIAQTESSQANLKWQKSLATPDLTLGSAYDQRGGAFTNQVNLSVGIPIPFWNSNKGNIKSAEIVLQQTNSLKEYKSFALKENLIAAVNNFESLRKSYNSIPVEAISNNEIVYKGILENFQKRNISLFEFTDFMESYNQTILQFNELNKQIIFAAEELNSIVNTEIF